MNVVLPEKIKIRKKQLIIYLSIITICIMSLIISTYVQFYARIDFAEILGIRQRKEIGDKSEEQIQSLKLEFGNLFNNNLINNNENKNNNKKVEKDKELVYTKYSNKQSKDNLYELNINIPYININNEIVIKYNKEIEDIFLSKSREIIEDENKKVIFTVEYVANIHDDILSLAIRSNLKEGTSAQRVIIQTYNYDLRNNKEITLEEIIRLEKLETSLLQEKIIDTIKEEEKKVQALKQLGYQIFERDIKSEMYNIENSKQYYYTGKELYIIYAYGKDEITSELDLVII